MVHAVRKLRQQDLDYLGTTAEIQTIIRPADILVAGLIFYRDSSFFLSFFLSLSLSPSFFLLLSFFRQVCPELAERNSTKIGYMVGSTRVIRKRMSEI